MFIPHTHIKPNHERIFVIGDLHGNLPILFRFFKEVKYNPEKDLLISTGDLIDRGKYNLESLMYFIDNPNVLVVAGNHEDLMVRSFFDKKGKSGHKAMWVANGGAWASDVDEFLLKRIAKLAMKQFYFASTVELPCGTRFGITHGDVIGNEWLGEEYANVGEKHLMKLQWSRLRAREKAIASHDISGVDFTIHGHTPKEKAWQFHNSIFIDTGAYHPQGGLSVIELNKFSRNKSLYDSIVYIPYAS